MFLLLNVLDVVAQSTPASPELGLLDYMNLGVLAFLVLAFIRGWVVPGYILQKEREEKGNFQEELTELRERVDNQILPALWSVTNGLARLLDSQKDK